MVVIRRTQEEVVRLSVEALGLDGEIADFGTPAVVAAAIRRAASFNCPTSPRHLVAAVEEAMRGLGSLGQSDDHGASVSVVLESLVAYGDLLEAPFEDDSGISRRVLFLGPPSYVTVSSATVLLVGIRGEGLALLDESLTERVEHQVHVRRMQLQSGEDAVTLFKPIGLLELSLDQWLEHPRFCRPRDLFDVYNERLDAAGPSGTIEGCRILDPRRSPTYYRGRWRSPTRRDNGRFVARRPVEFGADLWCFAELSGGSVVRLIDLPLNHVLNRGCDEAWRLQAAVDYLSGNPQKAQVGSAYRPTDVTLHLQSPIPSWAQRYLKVLGRPLPRQRGSLISFDLAKTALQDALRFLHESMWINHEYKEDRHEKPEPDDR